MSLHKPERRATAALVTVSGLLIVAMGTVGACSSNDSNPQGTGAATGLDASHVCGIGDTRACLGPAGCDGAQACLSDRSGFGVCDCGSTGSGGVGSGGAGPLDATSDAGGLDPALVPGPTDGKPCIGTGSPFCGPGKSCQIASANTQTCGDSCGLATSCADTCSTNAECKSTQQCYAGRCARLCVLGPDAQDVCSNDNKKCRDVGNNLFGVCTEGV